MTEPFTPREIRQGIAEQLAKMPANPDHNGKTDVDRQADADRFARFAEAVSPAAELPVQTGMKPNRAQGGGATVSAPAPTDPLSAIRAQASKLVL